MQLLGNGWMAPTQRTIPPFRLSRPGTVEQALDAWTGGGAEPVYAQGCTDLVAAFREGLQCSTLVSLARVAELCEVRREGDDLVIGAGVDHHQGAAHPLVAGALPGFASAWGTIATTRIRLRATIGGNLMARRTRYEMSIMLDALGADVRFATPDGPRVLTPAQVWDGPPAPGALLTAVRIPAVAAVRFGYERSMRPLMTVAAALRGGRLRLVAGGYSDGSPLVAEKAGYRAPGPYRWQHVDSVCECVMTNTTPAGPFRGFGATQVVWAGESQIDMIAERLGLDPLELRRRNLKGLGEPFMPGDSGIDSDLVAGLDLVARDIAAHRRAPAPNRGVGFAIGVKDGGGVNKPAQARVKIATDGSVTLQCGTVEIGQGASTTLCQIVAEILGVPVGRVVRSPVNTDDTPFDQGTNASSGIAVMGQAVHRACEDVRGKVLGFAADRLGCDPGELTLSGWKVEHDSELHPLPPLIMRHYGGTGYEFTGDGFFKSPNSDAAPLESLSVFWEVGWAGAEVEVDPETGALQVVQLVVSADVGRAVNEQVCRGQDEGAALMGYAQALFEEMRFDGPTLLNGEALDYRVPLAEDLPERFVSLLQQQGHGPGPFGSKGAGEGAMLPVAPALADAVADATGARITTLPLTPERVLDASADTPNS